MIPVTHRIYCKALDLSREGLEAMIGLKRKQRKKVSTAAWGNSRGAGLGWAGGNLGVGQGSERVCCMERARRKVMSSTLQR